MGLFDRQLSEIRDYLVRWENAGRVNISYHKEKSAWSPGEKNNVILAGETAVELGNPVEESTSFLVWTEDAGLVRDGLIALVGPDLPESAGRSLPFGKVVIVGGRGFHAENSYDRYRDLDSLRYGMDLKGYMMRAASQYQREWSRVSREALNGGMSFAVLGGALIDQLKRKEYITAAEVIFITSNRVDVLAMKKIGTGARKIISAMNKMMEEWSLDCGSCEFVSVCGDVEELRSMRDSLRKKEAALDRDGK